MGLSLKSTCSIEELKTNKIFIEFKNFRKKFEFTDFEHLLERFPDNLGQIKKGFQLVKEKIEDNLSGLKISLFSKLLTGSGLGSSASIAVSFLSAFNKFYSLNLTRKDISNMAYEMEKVVHGTPSGIDNTTCTYGNLLYFQEKKYELLSFPKNLNVLITYTGIRHKTGIAVEKISSVQTKILTIFFFIYFPPQIFFPFYSPD